MKWVSGSLVKAGLAVALTASALGCGPADGGGRSRPDIVKGVIGSEKRAFFEDAAVLKAFERHGLKIEVDPAGSRETSTTVDLSGYDFAFPSSAPAADRLQREHTVTGRHAPFSSPMAIATFQPIAELLSAAGVARMVGDGIWSFDVARYLDLVRKATRWDQLNDADAYPVRKNVLVSTTDPRRSNSAAMYLAIVGYVANDNKIVRGAEGERRVLPLLTRLFLDQGYTESSTEGPFEDYLSQGMGKTPMVFGYESQFVEAAIKRRTRPGMMLMYPTPTVLSKHTVIAFNRRGDQVGRLLTTDPELQRLAATYGFRGVDGAGFQKIVSERHVPVMTDLVQVIDPPSYDTLERLLQGVERSYGSP